MVVYLSLAIPSVELVTTPEIAKPRETRPPGLMIFCNVAPSGAQTMSFQCLERLNLHHVAGGLGFEDRLFLGEGIDALARLGGRLADDFDFRQARDREHARPALLQILGNQCGEVFEHAGDLFLAKLARFGQELSISDLVIGFFAELLSFSPL